MFLPFHVMRVHTVFLPINLVTNADLLHEKCFQGYGYVPLNQSRNQIDALGKNCFLLFVS